MPSFGYFVIEPKFGSQYMTNNKAVDKEKEIVQRNYLHLGADQRANKLKDLKHFLYSYVTLFRERNSGLLPQPPWYLQRQTKGQYIVFPREWSSDEDSALRRACRALQS